MRRKRPALRAGRCRRKGESPPEGLSSSGLVIGRARLRLVTQAWGIDSPTMGELVPWATFLDGALSARGVQPLERLAAGGDAELREEGLHVRADGVLGDEEPLGDLVGAQVLVEEEQHLELAGRERGRDHVRDGRLAMAALAHGLEEPPRDRARERRLSLRDAAQEADDPVR